MQMLQARGFGVEEVARIWRVPPFMIGHTEKNTSWGSGLEQQLIAFVTFALLPYLKKIQKRRCCRPATD
jgi:phage portal protein BeeE